MFARRISLLVTAGLIGGCGTSSTGGPPAAGSASGSSRGTDMTGGRGGGGGVGATRRGWGRKYIRMHRPAAHTAALTLLFEATNGANFVYGRIRIGASDYATSRYTDDETPGDLTMTNFSISRDQQFLIPYVKAALAVNSN